MARNAPTLLSMSAFATATLMGVIGATGACGSSDGNLYGGADGAPPGAEDDASTAPAKDGSPAADGANDATTDANPSNWPDCKTQPAKTQLLTLPTIWQTLDTGTPQGVFVKNVHVTAISGGACKAGFACQFFIQDASYATLPLAAHHAIKVLASGTVSKYFAGLAVGDIVDVSGSAWRFTLFGENELLIEVNLMLQGCANKTGAGALTGVPNVALSDFTVDHYEHTYGPVLVTVPSVSGKYTGPPSATFGLFPTPGGDAGGFDGGAAQDIVSLSPYFLPNGQFTGLTQGSITKFATITGVFDVFYAAGPAPTPDAGAPDASADAGSDAAKDAGNDAGTDSGAGGSTSYLELAPRTSADIIAN